MNQTQFENLQKAQKNLKPHEKIEILPNGEIIKVWHNKQGKREIENIQHVINSVPVVNLPAKPWAGAPSEGLKSFGDFGKAPKNEPDQKFSNDVCMAIYENIITGLTMTKGEVKYSSVTDTNGIKYKVAEFAGVSIFLDPKTDKIKKARTKNGREFYYRNDYNHRNNLESVVVCDDCKNIFSQSIAKLYNVKVGVNKCLCREDVKNYPDAVEVVIK